jgi:uncharacterized membrane protein YfcA
MMGGSLIGVDAGTRLLHALTGLGDWQLGDGARVPAVNVVIDALFLVLLSGVTTYTFRDALRARARPVARGDRTIPGPLVTHVRIPPYVDLPAVQLSRVSVPMLGYLGFVLGAASGLMGIGGGVLFMPVLLYGFGLAARNAAGTGVLLLFVTVVVGTFEQALHGYVRLELALAILVGSSIGSQLGALTTHVLRDRTLRLIFAVLVGATTLMVAWDMSRLLRE